jgi:hypothetical protein
VRLQRQWHCRTACVGAVFTAALTNGALGQGGTLPLWRYTTELSLELERPPRGPEARVSLAQEAVQVVANPRGQMFLVQRPGTITLFAPDGTIIGQRVLPSGERGWGSAAGTVGDSLWVWDAERKEVMIFAPTSDLSHRILRVGDSDGGTIGGVRLPSMTLKVRAVYGDGSVLAEGVSKDGDVRRTEFDGRGAPLVRVSRNKVVDIVGWIPSYMTRPDLLVAGPNSEVGGRGRAGAVLHGGWAPSVDGSYISTVEEPFQGPDTKFLQTRVLSARGDTVYHHKTYPFVLIPVAQSMSTSFAVRPYVPPVRDVFPASNGAVMLSMEAESRNGEQDYLIYDAKGQPLARLRLPFLIAVSQFDGEYVWGFWASRDPDVVLRLRVHPAGG